MSALIEILNRFTMVRALMLGFVLAAFYYFFMFDKGMAQTQAMATANTRIAELQAQIQSDQQKIDSAAVYKKTAAEVGSTIQKLLSLIPEDFSMPDLMRLVSNEAKTAGSSLASIDPKETVVSSVAKEFEEMVVSIDVAGSFLQHMVFLSNLTKINHILVVRKFEFKSEKEARGEEAPVVRMTAEIVGFRYRGTEKKEEVTQ